MGSPGVVVADVFAKQILQVPLSQDDEVIETFSPSGADEPLGVGVEVWTGDAGRMVGDPLAGVVDRHQYWTNMSLCARLHLKLSTSILFR